MLMTDSKYISIKGARVNNLKNIDVNIPRNKLVVITGLSGSGNHRSLSTPSMPRDSVATWKASVAMPASFWAE